MKIGEKFGELTCVSFAYKIGNKKFYRFRCSCGKEIIEYSRKILNGSKLSCGCLQTQSRLSVKGNKITNAIEYSIIHITHLNKDYRCLIDNEDLNKVTDYTWSIQEDAYGKLYAVSRSFGKTTLMHRLIKNCPEGYVVDHIDIKNTLDNRKQNLRIVTQRENMQNHSRKKFEQAGVHFRKDRNKYTVSICVNSKLIYLGQYNTYEEACLVRRNAEKKYWQ